MVGKKGKVSGKAEAGAKVLVDGVEAKVAADGTFVGKVKTPKSKGMSFKGVKDWKGAVAAVAKGVAAGQAKKINLVAIAPGKVRKARELSVFRAKGKMAKRFKKLRKQAK